MRQLGFNRSFFGVEPAPAQGATTLLRRRFETTLSRRGAPARKLPAPVSSQSLFKRALRHDGRTAGFTLLEILVTVALIGLLASVLIVGSTRLLSEQPVTPEDIFRKAVSEARKTAVEKNVDVRLAFSAKDKTFTSSSEADTRTYPVTGPEDLAFDFLSPQKGGSSVMIAGTVIETETLKFVTFYPDGTSTPFRVQFRLNGNVRVIAFDPWTCAPMLESEAK